jgi:hypothetical protein
MKGKRSGNPDKGEVKEISLTSRGKEPKLKIIVVKS